METKIKTGLDRLLSEGFTEIPIGDSPGLLCHRASVTSNLVYAVDALLGDGYGLKALFGPQHGIFGTDQANMVEWGSYMDHRTELQVFSLYGENRKPTSEMLEGLSSLIVDLQDVGARYYTYIWTALLCLRACYVNDLPMILLDRPNPIGGVEIEGPGIIPGYESFVGLSDVPVRHGCTIGELMRLFAAREGIENSLHVIPLKGWSRETCWENTSLEWVNPSPNMPSPETTLVYPGGCLIEGTNLSEGRGTTEPFFNVGAPWIDRYDFAAALDAEKIPGALFRPIQFKPVFDKYAGEICNGIRIHIIGDGFKPVITFYAIIKTARALFPDDFAWKKPPYEYEFEKLPIDILSGSAGFREAVEEDNPTEEVAEKWRENEAAFRRERETFLLY